MLHSGICASVCFFFTTLIGILFVLPSNTSDKMYTSGAVRTAARQQQSQFATPARNASMRRCPDGSGEDSSITPSRRAICILEVRNRQLDNVEILFVIPSPGGGEKLYWVIDFDSTFELQTFSGDRWRLRSRHGLLLKEISVPSGDDLPRRRVVVELYPCVPQNQPSPIAPSLPLEPPLDAAESSSCGAVQVLSSQPQPGMHLLCLSSTRLGGVETFVVTAFAHSFVSAASLQPSHRFLLPRLPSQWSYRPAKARAPDSELVDEAAAISAAELIAITMVEVRASNTAFHLGPKKR